MDDRAPRCRVVLTRRALDEGLRGLLRQAGGLAWGLAGIARMSSGVRLLAGHIRVVRVVPPAATLPAVAIMVDRGAGTGHERRDIVASLGERCGPDTPLALVTVELVPRRGRLTAELFTGGGGSPVEAVTIVGGGIHTIATSRPSHDHLRPLEPDETLRLGRLIGALGDAQWRRLRSLRIAVAGAGRSGSLVVTSLARAGLRAITVIDPDTVGLENLDATVGTTAADVGRSKVDVLCERARLIGLRDLEAVPVAASITSFPALAAVKMADVLVAAVDHDGARLAAAILAACYMKPLLDVATGVLGHGDARRVGGDVRLILPGDPCLLCLGGVADAERVREVFASNTTPGGPPRVWNEERAGSLLSLNHAVIGHALLLLQAFVSGDVAASTWRHLEFDAAAMPTVTPVVGSERPDCPLCRLSGAGDAGLAGTGAVAASAMASSKTLHPPV